MKAGDLAGLSAEEQRRLLAQMLQRRNAPPRAAETGTPEIPPRDQRPPGEPPLSFAQERLWFLQKLDAGCPVYNNPTAMRVVRAADLSALQRALAEVARRHEILRTTFAWREEGLCQVIHPAPALPYEVVDLSALPEDEREAELARATTEEARRTFDLEAAPPYRIRLFRLAGDHHVFFVNMHHIVTDAWSLGVFVREVMQLYEAFVTGRPSPLPELDVQYADFAAWQRGWVSGPRLERQLEYWRGRLRDLPRLALPTDRTRPPQSSFRGGREMVRLSPELSAALRELCGRENVTLFQAMLAAFKVVLLRYTGQEDVVVGSPVTNRAQAETEGLIGVFVNTLVLRTSLGGRPSFRELLGRVRETVLGAFAHQDLPFEKLVEALQTERTLEHAPFFQVMFGYPQVPLRGLEFGGLRAELYDVFSETAKFDIALSMTDWLDQLGFSLEYKTDLFDAETMRRLLEHLENVLRAAAADPDRPVTELPLISAAERHRLQVEWNDTARPSPALTVPAAFREQARRAPQAVAVTDGAGGMTYGELDHASDAVARALGALGAGPEERVAIAMDRTRDMAVAVLGVLKSGAAYVPLEIGVPRARQEFVLREAGVRAILADAALRPSLPDVGVPILTVKEAALAGSGGPPPDPTLRPETLAYLIYTSGSTGQPKGVLVEHGSLARYLDWVNTDLLGPRPEAFPMVTSLAFDMCLKQFLAPLLRGDAAWLVPMAAVAQPAELCRILAARPRAGFNCVPSLWQALLDPLESGDVPRPDGLSCLVFGGERPSERLLARTWALFPELEVLNVYGPTEATSNASYTRLRPGDPITVGRPIAHTRLYVLDPWGEPAPIGVSGEVTIGGDNLARGYLGRPRIEAERFVADRLSPTPGGRLYRTGDRGRWHRDGRLELIDRLDDQVKVRGFRVELGEIEAALRACAGVDDAAVRLRGEEGSPQLVAYIVPAAGEAPDIPALPRLLKERLPDYMVPRLYCPLESLPRFANGKLNAAALPPPSALRPAVESPFAAPRTEVERTLVEVWREVLKVERIGVNDSFFELGGHSLLILQVQSRLRARLGREVPIVEFFRHPTVHSLARHLSGDEPDQAPAEADRARSLSQGKRAMGALRARAGSLAREE